MLANILFRNGNTELREVKMGSNALTGHRITSIVLENPQDIIDLVSNKEWAIRQLATRFPPKLPSAE